MQHDVQELNRVLCEKLEDKMKGTVVEGTIEQLFEGHHINYIECINVDYKSSRKESFYDLQLDVKGCRDVYASFDKYVEVEHLEGDNKYHAEQYGLQINDRYEFPLQLDLDRDNGKYLAPDADRSIRNLYTLHSVLVHSGGVHGGHYYAFIRPTLSDQWYKFDDERVTKEDTKKALEEQYGGEEELPQINPGFNNTPFKFTKYSNAYMLVYIRESDKEKIMCNVDEKDIAEHLRIRLKKEQEEKEHKKKEKAEAHLYTIIKIARDEDLKEQIGKNIYFDLVDHEKVHSFRIQKQLPFTSFKVLAQKTLHVYLNHGFMVMIFGYYSPLCKRLSCYSPILLQFYLKKLKWTPTRNSQQTCFIVWLINGFHYHFGTFYYCILDFINFLVALYNLKL
ncbi:Ubiquitin carboxyl-terminal hydrolase 13 [Zea mays]|uniref:Ubiquitin carboxyl-terminal hydrolase 13 n=1 Tax=Zea mays TaxID=4577 RepID=A0A1D6IUI7_MAIZE|nr:Ubiquitin carboxyl-terminal hydrolase 13 [Zea mays]